MEAASNAALIAPALPIAKVATGIPAGICTIESKESRPLRACDWMGTPNIGNDVLAANIPGKWAAPPAPAIIISMPLERAFSAKLNNLSGVRCAEIISTS